MLKSGRGRIWAPLREPGKKKMKLTEIYMLPPSRLINFIYGRGRQFDESILGESGEMGLRSFWETVSEWEPYQTHPALTEMGPGELHKLLPLFLFVDGYEVHRRSEYYAWLWCSGMTRTGSSYGSVFPIAVVRHACMPTNEIKKMVFWEIYRYIASDFAWMQAGLTRDGAALGGG